MWKSKKFILVAFLATLVLAGSIGGIVLAQTGNGDESQPKAQHGALLDRVYEIYEENTGVAINPQELKDAFAQARSEMRDEALDRRLQKLVDQGEITQEQADQYKTWKESRPDIPVRFGFRGHRGHRFGGATMHPTE